jgi:hypothetical protein
MIKVKILGAKSSAANIRKMDKATRKRFYEEMLKVCKEILKHSQDKYVPILTGALRKSGKVKGFPGRYPTVNISYGSAVVPYALLQHENKDFYHPGGKSYKYLEFAVKDFEPTMKKRLEEAVRNETKKYSMAGRVRGV